jgi:hypothetical protein
VGKALYIQSVEDAAAIAGGYERLAAALGVSADQVRSWSAGASIPECAVFLRLIEILLDPVLAKDPVPQPPLQPETGGLSAAPEAG